MIRKVVVIRSSHRTQCLITTSVDITTIDLTTDIMCRSNCSQSYEVYVT